MTHWNEESGAPGRPAPDKESKPHRRPREDIIPEKKVLVKGLGFIARTVRADGDTWVEIYSDSFADSRCILDLESAQELKKVVLASVDRLGRAKP